MCSAVSRCLIGLLTACFLTGCAFNAGETETVRDVPDFPRPAPLKSDSAVILLQISLCEGDLCFVSLDQPDWHDIRVGGQDITMDSGPNVRLHSPQLEWNLGETTVILKDCTILITKHSVDGKSSRITLLPARDLIRVTCNGQWQMSTPVELVELDARSGRIISY
jgi:hypothetical protein